MIIKDKFCVDLEGLRDRGGRNTYYIAEVDSRDPEVFHIGGYRYNQYGQALTAHAPKVIDVWSSADESRYHAKERRMSMADAEFFAWWEWEKNKHIPWKERTRLFEIPMWKELTGTCQRCGVSVTHRVRQLIEEARYGARTIAEIEAVSVCRRVKCKGPVVIELAKARER